MTWTIQQFLKKCPSRISHPFLLTSTVHTLSIKHQKLNKKKPANIGNRAWYVHNMYIYIYVYLKIYYLHSIQLRNFYAALISLWIFLPTGNLLLRPRNWDPAPPCRWCEEIGNSSEKNRWKTSGPGDLCVNPSSSRWITSKWLKLCGEEN